jgi:hypothetical protein
MGRLVFLSVVSAAIVAVVMPGSGVAAKPVFHSHQNFSDTFSDGICGIPGTSVVRGVENFTLYADNTFKDTFTISQTFTATASGKSVRIHAGNQVTGNDEPIDNGDGTITFITTFKGLPEQLKIPQGPMLSRDAGVVTFTDTFDEVTGALISRVVSGEKGPHPDLDSDFAPFCNVLMLALT